MPQRRHGSEFSDFSAGFAAFFGVREEFFRPAFIPLTCNFVTNVLTFVSNVCLKMFRNCILLFHNCTAKRTCFLYYSSQLYIQQHVIQKPRWRPLEVNDRSLRLHGKIWDCKQSNILKHGGIASRGHCISFPQAV